MHACMHTIVVSIRLPAVLLLHKVFLQEMFLYSLALAIVDRQHFLFEKISLIIESISASMTFTDLLLFV
jgi:hypothetical protein